jgi:putative DNA-invertase from lambdoid prophage Rac
MHLALTYTMSRLFAYARVSTSEQTTDNQLREISAAGFSIEHKRTVTESISGSVAASLRLGFTKLVDRMEEGDILVVTKLDRLGRNAMDVRTTIEKLSSLGIRVHCLQLGGANLTSAADKLTMQVLCAVAEFERDLLIERTQSGIERAKSEGKHMGRKHSLSTEQREQIQRRLAGGQSVRSIASEFSTTRQTIIRVRTLTASPGTSQSR